MKETFNLTHLGLFPLGTSPSGKGMGINMKKIKNVLTAFVAFGFLWITAVFMAEASEVSELNQIMTIHEKCEARKQPDQNAPVVHSYAEGEAVWVTGETADGWYKVSYQEQEGYIPKEKIIGLQIETDEVGRIDFADAGFDEELAETEAEGKILVEEVERQRREKRRLQVWMIFTILLIAGIFTTGFLFVSQREKKLRKTK